MANIANQQRWPSLLAHVKGTVKKNAQIFIKIKQNTAAFIGKQPAMLVTATSAT